jgi:hypothetical protein
MSTGHLASLAIEFLIRSDADSAQKNYENELKSQTRRLCEEFGLESNSALEVTLKQLRTLRLQEREVKALLIFRSNFPELNGEPDSKVIELIRRLESIERESGRLEVVKARVLRSNIHTVLKPLDHSWNTRFGLDQMQRPAEEAQAMAAALLAERVSSVDDFNGWERKVFALFESVLVYDGPDINLKPAGTIDPRQVRLYKRNWMNWCDVNKSRVIETMNNREIDLESKPRTRTYNLNSQLRRQKASNIQKSINMEMVLLEQLQKQIYEESKQNSSSDRKAELMEVYKQNSARLAILHKELQVEREMMLQGGLTALPKQETVQSYKTLVRRLGNEDLEGERTWQSKQELMSGFGPWVASLQRVWEDAASQLVITLESHSENSKVLFAASSYTSAEQKIKSLVSGFSSNEVVQTIDLTL